jgi:hypothetical protein
MERLVNLSSTPEARFAWVPDELVVGDRPIREMIVLSTWCGWPKSSGPNHAAHDTTGPRILLVRRRRLLGVFNPSDSGRPDAMTQVVGPRLVQYPLLGGELVPELVGRPAKLDAPA